MIWAGNAAWAGEDAVAAKGTCTAEDYWALPEGVRAELIGGELWDMASPNRVHQEIVMELSAQLRGFVVAHGGACKVYPAPFAVNLFANDSTFVEPDVSVICDHDKLSDRGCEGAPDFVAEVVSPSDMRRDYVTKLNLYSEAGVREYWICDPAKQRVLVYRFDTEDEPPAIYPFSEPVPSGIFPGFVVDFGQVMAGM